MKRERFLLYEKIHSEIHLNMCVGFPTELTMLDLCTAFLGSFFFFLNETRPTSTKPLEKQTKG